MNSAATVSIRTRLSLKQTRNLVDQDQRFRQSFEAENYTSRTPDTDVHWKVEEIKNAYEKTVLGPTGNFGGMLRYEFDIRICGTEAKGGEWYFWARLVNPKNQSDFMLAEGHPTLWGTVKLIH